MAAMDQDTAKRLFAEGAVSPSSITHTQWLTLPAVLSLPLSLSRALSLCGLPSLHLPATTPRWLAFLG